MKKCPKCKQPMTHRWAAPPRKYVCMLCVVKRANRMLARLEQEKYVMTPAYITQVPSKDGPNQMISLSKTAGKAGWIPCTVGIKVKYRK